MNFLSYKGFYTETVNKDVVGIFVIIQNKDKTK